MNQKNNDLLNFIKRNKDAVLAVVTIVFVYFLFYLFKIGCPIKFLTGISCAGCGMTRAYFELLRLDIKGAFYYHPLFFLPPLFIVFIWQKKRFSEKTYKLILFTFILFFVIVYLYRMLFVDGDIVVFNPKESIFYKIYSFLSGRI